MLQSIRTPKSQGSYIFYFPINSESQLLIFKFVTTLVSQNLNRKNMQQFDLHNIKANYFLDWIEFTSPWGKINRKFLFSLCSKCMVFTCEEMVLANYHAFVCGLKDKKESYHLSQKPASKSRFHHISTQVSNTF